MGIAKIKGWALWLFNMVLAVVGWLPRTISD